MKHTYLSTRIHRGAIDVAACASFESSEKEDEEAWQKFRDAITEWTQTDEGSAAWFESVEDFNIGDAICCALDRNQEFLRIALKYGISDISLYQIPFDNVRPFDEVLSDRQWSEDE